MAEQRPLTPQEILDHPEFEHLIWDLKPEKKGQVAVAKSRGGPINIAYEIHGHGDRHLVWLMGLGAMKYQWQRQTKDLAHDKADQYTSLIIDNRGVGESDKPLHRYSTSEMAKDVVEVLDHVGWTGKREVHLIGVSMGGMIAQEVAMLIPTRLCTLSLISTAASIFNTSGFIENLRNRLNLFIPKPLDKQVENLKHNLCTSPWLLEPDCLEPAVQKFPTNGDRVAANEIWKRLHPEYFSKKPFLLQLIAAGWHYKAPSDLALLAEKVGKARILVVHGTEDRMISFPHGVVLWRGLEKGEGKTGREYVGMEVEEDVWEMGEVEKRFVRGQAHVLPIEMRGEFNGWIEGLVEKGRKLNAVEGV